MGELGRDWARGVGVTVPVTGGGGTTKLGRYVGHWSVQKLGVGGSEGRQGGGLPRPTAVGNTRVASWILCCLTFFVLS